LSERLGAFDGRATFSLVVDSLEKMNGDLITRFFGDARTQFGVDGQLVRSVAKSHEGRSERMTVDGALNLDESSRTEVLR